MPEPIREAAVSDAPEIARLLHDFNSEYSWPTPGVAVLTERAQRLLEEGAITVLLAGEPPVGLAMVRFRPSIWTGALDAYLEEFYVAPEQRRRGIGRALLEATMEAARQAGANHLDLATAETDTAARALYESCGLSCRENGRGGPLLLFYEREL